MGLFVVVFGWFQYASVAVLFIIIIRYGYLGGYLGYGYLGYRYLGYGYLGYRVWVFRVWVFRGVNNV